MVKAVTCRKFRDPSPGWLVERDNPFGWDTLLVRGSAGEAVKEAQRLASEHPGKFYRVIQGPVRQWLCGYRRS